LGNKIEKHMWISTSAYSRVWSPTFLSFFNRNIMIH
jgi:hypothetical protein